MNALLFFRAFPFCRKALAALLLVLPALAAAHTVPDTLEQRLKACTACHGKEGRASTDAYYPRIAGKPDGYLLNQLKNFRDGKRAYPMMTYMVGNLPDAYLKEIAAYFAGQHPPYAAPQTSEAAPAVLERGRILVQQGDKLKKLPACISCHGEKMTGVAPFIPGLLGLPRDYLVAQLGAWQTGSRHAQAPDCMQQIALKLSPQDVGAASAWLAAQTVPARASAPHGDEMHNFRLPLSCGSMPE